MPTITLDVRAKPVRRDTQIWRIFPGKDYSFLGPFLEKSLVFLNLPEVVLPEGEITPETRYLREMVKRAVDLNIYSSAMAQYVKDGKGNAPSKPSSALDEYTSTPNLRRIGTGISAVINMFAKAQLGDLIVMPELPNERSVRIGEFDTEPLKREVVTLEAPYPEARLSARSVKWLARVDELRIPRQIANSLRHQVAISELGNEYILEILDLAYGAYVFAPGTKGARVNTSAAEFTDQDNLDLSLIVKLCAQIAWDISTEIEFDNPFESYINRILPNEASLFISSNINSPGSLNLKGTTLAPILFLAMFSLLLTCDSASKPNPEDIHVVNSLGVQDDPDAAAIEQMVRQSMVFMGKSDWTALKERGRRLKEHPKLRITSRGSFKP